MIIFDIFINFIESVMFSYFLAKYFNLKSKYLYVTLTTIIQLFFLAYANIINNSGLILSICIVLFMLLSLIVWEKRITFDYIYITLLYNSFIIIVAIIGILITDILNTIFPLMNEELYYYFKCCIAKFLQVLLTVLFIKKEINLSISLDFRKWGFVILLEMCILSLLVVSVYSMVLGVMDYNSIVLVLILSFVIAMLYRYTIYKTDQMNQEKVKFARMEELVKFNSEKLAMMNHIKDEISATDHRMFYMLLQMEQYLESKQYDRLEYLIKEYRNMITKYKIVVDTNNVIFDCLYSLKINDLILKGKNIENTIFISCKSEYNDIEFINFILKFLDYFDKCQTIFVSMHEIGNMLMLRVVYRNGKIEAASLSEYLYDYFQTKDNWNLDDHMKKGVRISINMENVYEK